MSRPSSQTPPAYCLHKASGRAVVRIGKKDHYLGTYGSADSHDEYARLIAEWRANVSTAKDGAQSAVDLAGFQLTISEVIQRYREFAEGYYTKDGEATKELAEMRYALRPVRLLYGSTLARGFGPLKLKVVQQHMIDELKLSRRVINSRTKRIKRAFKWAVSEELVPASVSHALSTVSGLRHGRTNAREVDPVRPVADAWVDLVLPHLSPPVAALVRLQRLTGMRPGEVVLMRLCDIDMSGDVWFFSPHDHKNEWRERSRIVPLGPQSQAILKPFLDRSRDAYLFSPKEAEAWRNERRAQSRNPARKTPIFPSELAAREKRKLAARRRSSKRPKRDRYDVDSYRRAISYAIERLNVVRLKNEQELIPKWYPLQLRHSRATEVRKAHGIEAAQVSLGHVHADVTQVYAERNLELAVEIARKSG